MNFSISNTEGDNSFYFHFYSDAEEPVRIPNTPLQERGDGKIDFNDYQISEFKRDHLSHHHSGAIHSKDKKGNKLTDGNKGINFDDIEVSRLVMVCAPVQIDKLPIHKKLDNTKDIIIHLKDDIQAFTLHYDVYRKSKIKEMDISNPNLLFGGYIMVAMENKDFGLRIYAQRVGGKPFWPPFNLILNIIGE
ncbi:hypothetical protein K1F50_01625 [Muricauda oceani]|uniref:Uncharacterized protein n=1 Tax=Flagellimonas oceani TaxID=2698672 RepID=A0A6G7J0Y7_9FLAO|nr:hypothetical protein [Allomuricauda oceani]MBW8241481.1 hypothetical protein [Allomuricauda oceani]QII44523.1 hypothetical protein GVT53_07485 [Allomuricauda oceani]